MTKHRIPSARARSPFCCVGSAAPNLGQSRFTTVGRRTSRGSAGRGYYRKQFEPWWERYCAKQSDAEIRQLCTEEKEKP